jgi:hypothetical protein
MSDFMPSPRALVPGVGGRRGGLINTVGAASAGRPAVLAQRAVPNAKVESGAPIRPFSGTSGSLTPCSG